MIRYASGQNLARNLYLNILFTAVIILLLLIDIEFVPIMKSIHFSNGVLSLKDLVSKNNKIVVLNLVPNILMMYRTIVLKVH